MKFSRSITEIALAKSKQKSDVAATYIIDTLKKNPNYESLKKILYDATTDIDNPAVSSGKEFFDAVAYRQNIENQKLYTAIAALVIAELQSEFEGKEKPLFLPVEALPLAYMFFSFFKMSLNANLTEELFGIEEEKSLFDANAKQIFLKNFSDIANYPEKNIRFIADYPYNFSDKLEQMSYEIDEYNSVFMLDLLREFAGWGAKEAEDKKDSLERFDYLLGQIKKEIPLVGDALRVYKKQNSH